MQLASLSKEQQDNQKFGMELKQGFYSKGTKKINFHLDANLPHYVYNSGMI